MSSNLPGHRQSAKFERRAIISGILRLCQRPPSRSTCVQEHAHTAGTSVSLPNAALSSSVLATLPLLVDPEISKVFGASIVTVVHAVLVLILTGVQTSVIILVMDQIDSLGRAVAATGALPHNCSRPFSGNGTYGTYADLCGPRLFLDFAVGGL